MGKASNLLVTTQKNSLKSSLHANSNLKGKEPTSGDRLPKQSSELESGGGKASKLAEFFQDREKALGTTFNASNSLKASIDSSMKESSRRPRGKTSKQLLVATRTKSELNQFKSNMMMASPDKSNKTPSTPSPIKIKRSNTVAKGSKTMSSLNLISKFKAGLQILVDKNLLAKKKADAEQEEKLKMIKEKFGDEETPRTEKSKSSRKSQIMCPEEKDMPMMPGEKEYIKLLLKGFTRNKNPITK